LTKLDVSNNTRLYQLFVSENYMQSVDDVIGWREIGRLVLGSTFIFYPQNTPPVTLENIVVTTLPAKLIYTAGETLNLYGMVVTATYSEGTSESVTGFTTNPVANAVLNTPG